MGATVEQLANLVRGRLVGDGNVPIQGARPVQEAGPGEEAGAEEARTEEGEEVARPASPAPDPERPAHAGRWYSGRS